MTGVGAGSKDGTAGNQVAGLTSDYALTQPTVASVNQHITTAPLTGSATITGADKTYDGLLVATGSTIAGSITGGLLNGDTATLNASGYALAFNSAHVVDAASISASGSAAAVVTGVGAGSKDGTAGNQVAGLTSDYALTQPTVASVNQHITTAPLTGSATITGSGQDLRRPAGRHRLDHCRQHHGRAAQRRHGDAQRQRLRPGL